VQSTPPEENITSCPPYKSRISPPREGAGVYLFADGHVRYLESRQILPANDNLPDINLTKDGIRGADAE
jgi:prepilin-type processing-associated H-X9-DG protein